MSTYDFPPPWRVFQSLGLEPGETLYRLMRVYYPVQIVTADVQERLAEDFEEIELTLETLIAAGVANLAHLASLIGIDDEDAAKFVRLAVGYGHVDSDSQGRLSLTALGRESLQRGQKLTRFTRPQTLRCDGITGVPLDKQFYVVPLADLAHEPSSLTSIIMPRLEVDRSALEAIITDPHRTYRNVVDEVESIGAIQHAEILYFRALLAMVMDSQGALNFRLFLAPQLFRDNVNPAVFKPLLAQSDLDLNDLATWLQDKQIPCGPDDLALRPDGNLSIRVSEGVEVPSTMEWLLQFLGNDPASAPPNDLIMDVRGQGRLAYIWSPDPALRKRAAVVQAINILVRGQQGALNKGTVHSACTVAGGRLGVSVNEADLLEKLSSTDSPFLERLEQALTEL